jgi:hypothetical protein
MHECVDVFINWLCCLITEYICFIWILLIVVPFPIVVVCWSPKRSRNREEKRPKINPKQGGRSCNQADRVSKGGPHYLIDWQTMSRMHLNGSTWGIRKQGMLCRPLEGSVLALNKPKISRASEIQLSLSRTLIKYFVSYSKRVKT